MENRNRAKTIILVLSLIIVAAIAAGVSQYVAKNQLRKELSASKDEMLQLKNEMEYLAKKNKADDLFFDGNYDSAMSIYQSLENIAFKEKLIQQRLLAAERLEASEQSDEKNDGTSISSALRQELASAKKSYEASYDSLKNAATIEIANLNAELAVKERMLSDLERPAEKETLEKVVGRLDFYSKNGTKTEYFGEISGGKAYGEGMGYYSTGNVYVGQWKNNMKHGEAGVFKWLEGEKYVGDYVNDKKEGQGKYYLVSGEYYEGEFANDKINGIGTWFDREGKVKLKGKWKDGELVKSAN